LPVAAPSLRDPLALGQGAFGLSFQYALDAHERDR
jgi:hypothetical protein